MNTSVSNDSWGAWDTWQTKNSNGSCLSDIIEVRRTLLPNDAECVGSSVSQYYLQKKLTN